MSDKKKILLVCANPRGSDHLRTAEEDRTLRESVQLSPHRERFEIETLNAATVDDLRRALLRSPVQIVHFSGHGSKRGLVFEDSTGNLMVPPSSALAELLHRRGVETVLLNACYSLSVGRFTAMGLENTIATSGPISDPAAIEFTRGFYDALGAGTSVEDAYQEGHSAARLKGFSLAAVLLGKNEEFVAEELKPDPVRPTRDSGSEYLKTLLGLAIDTSGSMQSSIRNSSAQDLSRFEGVTTALGRLGSQVRERSAGFENTADDALSVFLYAFGIRIGQGVADLPALLEAAGEIDLDSRIQESKRRHESQARRQARDLSGLAGLARSYGFGSVVDSVMDAAADSVKQRIVAEVAGDVLSAAQERGDCTVTPSKLADLLRSSSSGGDTNEMIEHVLFGSTPMVEAARVVKDRFARHKGESFDQRTLVVVSDGSPTDGDPRTLFAEIRKMGVDIVTCFVTDIDISNPRVLAGSARESWSSGARLMWDIATEVDEQSLFAQHLLSFGWQIEKGGKLFVQANHSEVLEEFLRLASLNEAKEDGLLLPAGR